PVFIRMSLTMTSGRRVAIFSMADSPLCAYCASKPSCVKTSHSSSQVTRSSSTTVMRGRSSAMTDLGWRGGIREADLQPERSAAGRGGGRLDRTAVVVHDVARDRQAEAA